MKYLFCILAICIITAAHNVSAQENSTIKIICYDGKAAIFPSSWLDKKTKAKATEADTAKFRLDKAMLDVAFGYYTKNFIEKEVEHIYVVGRLSFNGQHFTGTNSRKDIYIASTDNNEIEKTFHHEFSSILLRNHADYSFEMKWRELSPELRSGNSAAAVKSGLFEAGFDSVLCAKGYLCRYSLSNWENDFNMYAENIFAGGKAFWKIVDRYPKVQAKVKLIVDFYTKLWGGYNEVFFRVRED